MRRRRERGERRGVEILLLCPAKENGRRALITTSSVLGQVGMDAATHARVHTHTHTHSHMHTHTLSYTLSYMYCGSGQQCIYSECSINLPMYFISKRQGTMLECWGWNRRAVSRTGHQDHVLGRRASHRGIHVPPHCNVQPPAISLRQC